MAANRRRIGPGRRGAIDTKHHLSARAPGPYEQAQTVECLSAAGWLLADTLLTGSFCLYLSSSFSRRLGSGTL